MPALSSRVAFASSSSNPSSVAAPVGQGSGERFPRPLQSQELLSWTDPVTGSSITRVNRIVIDNAIPDKKVNSIFISHTPMPNPIRLQGSGKQNIHFEQSGR